MWSIDDAAECPAEDVDATLDLTAIHGLDSVQEAIGRLQRGALAWPSASAFVHSASRGCWFALRRRAAAWRH